LRSEQSVLSFSSNRFLIGELHLGKPSETVVVHGNAPHDRPRFLVSHLIGNRASFLCTKAPMPRVPDKLSGHSQDLCRSRRQRPFFSTTPSIAVFWTNGPRCEPAHICGAWSSAIGAAAMPHRVSGRMLVELLSALVAAALFARWLLRGRHLPPQEHAALREICLLATPPSRP